jgi:indole-3-glycerol phosphate synthase
MSDILRRIVASKRLELDALQRAQPLAEVRARAADAPPVRDFSGALRGARPRGRRPPGGANIIAELKRRSPSKGAFPWHGDVARQVRDYERGGARAVSVVTDGPFFGGAPELLAEVKAAVGLPVLQKEFLLEPWQVFHSRVLGADACLLIAAILPGGLLGEMLAAAREAGLHTLVEVVDAPELQRASAAGALVVGVNNRDLTTFRVDPGRTERLLPLYSDDQVCVAESGIRTPGDVERLVRAGVDGFLIGEALMTASDPADHLRALRGEAQQEAAS